MVDGLVGCVGSVGSVGIIGEVGVVEVGGFVGMVGSNGSVGPVVGSEVVPPVGVEMLVEGKVVVGIVGLVGRISMEDSSITTGTSSIKRMANSKLQVAIKNRLVIKIILQGWFIMQLYRKNQQIATILYKRLSFSPLPWYNSTTLYLPHPQIETGKDARHAHR